MADPNLRSELFSNTPSYNQPNSGDWYASDSTGYSNQQQPPQQQFTTQQFTPQQFTPQPAFDQSYGIGGAPPPQTNFDDEPPLLEELGINFAHIWTKTSSVLIPTKEIDQHILDDTDMAGPLVFSLVQGVFLLFSGKLHFGYLFGFGAVGCFLMNLLLNLMSQGQGIDMYRVVSVFGYCLLPIVILSGLTVFVSLRGMVGYILTLIAILWCTQTATRFFEVVLGMREQRYLIAYPVFLLYALFALITIF